VIEAVSGTRDILPAETGGWQAVEAVAHRLFARYGYREIRTPAFEATELFARGIGEETDIVSKEMYTFEDRDGSSLTLRPEATAGIVRAVIQHGLIQTDPALKVYALGPMFRRERPQKGRFRQFHQIDVEAFGMVKPGIDVEMIELALELLRHCGVADFELLLNSVGDGRCRADYVEVLRRAIAERVSGMCGDCQRRAETNPLRVLDCKVPEDQAAIEALPRIGDHLCPECRDHFAEVRRQLDVLGIPYKVDHRLVRGLDYYARTTFEVTSGALGAQNSLLGGGRYDGLVQQLGGPDVAGIGFAVGLERLIMALPSPPQEPRCDAFLICLAPEGLDRALLLQRALRVQGLRVLMDYEGRGLKSQMKRADKLGARRVLILGEDELRRGVWAMRDMAGSAQEEVREDELAGRLKETIDG
jgi:histidyl-tRNA synthetase